MTVLLRATLSGWLAANAVFFALTENARKRELRR